MPTTRPPYPLEFREQIVELVRIGRTPAELAREFEPTATTIRKWVKQADRNEGLRDDGSTSEEKEELRAKDIRVGRKRVARLMREASLQGVSRRRGTVATTRDADCRPASDLVERNFEVVAPDELWVADITYIPTWAGFHYLAVVVDAYSRRVVGWSMKTHLRTDLVLEALNMALWQRRPEAVIHHSDQGTQYPSIAFGLRCRESDVQPSMGSVGDAYDNALCESFFAGLECELLERRTLRTRPEAKMAVFEYIEGFYNPHRRHSALDYLSPIHYESSHQRAA